jgi:acetoin utilization protein AcuC
LRHTVGVYLGDSLASYNFGFRHPFGPDRYPAFVQGLRERKLTDRYRRLSPIQATEQDVRVFHSNDYLAHLSRCSATGEGFLDSGDTPAFKGVREAALTVVGSVLDGLDKILQGELQRVFVPIAGLHHARRDRAAGFCALNDCAVAVTQLRRRGVRRIAYVDIDAHHGDGVFYSFESDPDCQIVDVHEDGRFLFPGSGGIEETGKGAAQGTKLNIPLPPEADDALFREIWYRAESFLARSQPEFVLFQCGVDSLSGDPLADLELTPASHALATRSLCQLADSHCDGRLLVMGGGGYDLGNIAAGWGAVVEQLILYS